MSALHAINNFHQLPSMNSDHNASDHVNKELVKINQRLSAFADLNQNEEAKLISRDLSTLIAKMNTSLF